MSDCTQAQRHSADEASPPRAPPLRIGVASVVHPMQRSSTQRSKLSSGGPEICSDNSSMGSGLRDLGERAGKVRCDCAICATEPGAAWRKVTRRQPSTYRFAPRNPHARGQTTAPRRKPMLPPREREGATALWPASSRYHCCNPVTSAAQRRCGRR